MNCANEAENESWGIPAPVLADWHPATTSSELGPDETRVWVVDLDKGVSAEDDEDALGLEAERGILSADEQARADRFVRPRDRRRFVRCRAALREILGQLLAVRAGSVAFRAVGHGKPELDWAAMGTAFLAGRRELQFNVSHSGGRGLIAVGRGRALGVDIEKVRLVTEAERIVASYFTPAESAAFGSIHDEAKAVAFVRGWTRKEAILKGLGIGLAGLAARYETGFGSAPLAPTFAPATPPGRIDDWHLWEAAPRPGYVAALAIHAIRQGDVFQDQHAPNERVVATSDQKPLD